jgi:hypothetical protein
VEELAVGDDPAHELAVELRLEVHRRFDDAHVAVQTRERDAQLVDQGRHGPVGDDVSEARAR